MMRHLFAVFVLGVLFATRPAHAAEANVAQLTAQVEKLMDAYNRDDVKAFFSDWAKAVEAVANDMTYDALFKTGAKNEVGTYVAKSAKLRKEGSVLEGDFLVVYFDAEFSKQKQGQIAVNFQKEGDGYKFLQVQFSKKQ